jgi:hypothetical protein
MSWLPGHVTGPVTGEQVGHFHVHVHPFPEAGRLAQAYQDIVGAVMPGPLPGTHLAAAALGTNQRVVTVGVQRCLPASAAEGARLAQWQAEVPREPHPVCPPDVVVRLVRVVVAVLLPVADVADEPRAPDSVCPHAAPSRAELLGGRRDFLHAAFQVAALPRG